MKKTNQELITKIFGNEVRKVMSELATDDPELSQLIEEIPIEKIWARPGLPIREKSLVTISSQIAMQRWDQVQLHMESFLHLGGTKAELREVCIHLSVYCGFPATLAALKVLKDL